MRRTRAVWTLPMVVLTMIPIAALPAFAQDATVDPSEAIPEPSPSAAAASAPAVPITGDQGPLEAGRYVDTSLGREITFELGDGWTNLGAVPDAGLAIIKGEEDGPYLAIVPFDGGVFTDACLTVENEGTFGADPTPLEASPEAFISHLAAHPYLTVSEPVDVEIGGLSGLQVDAVASVPPECEPPWAWLWVVPVFGDYHLSHEAVGRFIALDGGDRVITLVIEVSGTEDSTALTDEGMAVLGSLEFGESE